jgi:hypothetical protein
MSNVLALQKLEFSDAAVEENSGESVTCTGCSCASNVCKSEVVVE